MGPTQRDDNLWGEPVDIETAPAEPEPDTRGQQVALIEWIGLEQQAFRR